MIHRSFLNKNLINQSLINQSLINQSLINQSLMNNKKNVDREITGYLKPSQYNIIWNVSWLSLSSSLYAIYKGHYNLAFVPGGVFLTSINYWREPAVSSWRRTLDVGYVNMALIYQLYKVYITNAQYSKEYYFFTGIASVCYQIGMYYYKKKKYWKHIIYHSGLHIFANIANFILYSGYI
jgi:hypothetical protein